MESSSNDDQQSSGEYLKGMLTLFITISLIEAGVIAFLLFGNSTPENPEVSKLDLNNNLSFEPSPLPIATPTIAPESKKFLLNKNYNYPIRDVNNVALGEISYKIVEYELTNQVVVNKLYKALVANDKQVLVIHLELTNDLDNAVQIITGDYIRLKKNNEEKLIAPDMNSDPVEIRPKSTKNTTLGFTIDKGDTDVKLLVGELEGEKDIIQIN